MASETPSEFLKRVTCEMHSEVLAGKQYLQTIWEQPLADRQEKGYSLGPLLLKSIKSQRLATFTHQTRASRESFCALQEGSLIRITQDQPTKRGTQAVFLHDDGDEVRVEILSGGEDLIAAEGWTLDPDFWDPTERFLATIDALSSTQHGLENVLPILMGHQESETEMAELCDWEDELEADEEERHPAQVLAIAHCLAANNFHLVQGPPGTGKTHVLAQVALRLVEKGERVLVTGPTHRSIHNALIAIQKDPNTSVPVVKIGGFSADKNSPYPVYERLSDANLSADEPYILGATCYALWANLTELKDSDFDSVLLDEASQFTLLQAAMAMLRAKRFFFYGDHQQLPPVRQSPRPVAENEASIFARLQQQQSTTLLTESWRLNHELAAWPSATYYGNELHARFAHRLRLKSPSKHPALQESPSLVLLPQPAAENSTLSHDEAETAVELILQLLRGGLSCEEIAVITPFRAQAARIRGFLRSREEFQEWPVSRIAVDTVERLQGQERDVVILSFAASRTIFVHRLADFIFQPQRLNVAVTRARCKTIVLYSTTLHGLARGLADNHSGANTFCSLLETQAPISHGNPHP